MICGHRWSIFQLLLRTDVLKIRFKVLWLVRLCPSLIDNVPNIKDRWIVFVFGIQIDIWVRNWDYLFRCWFHALNDSEMRGFRFCSRHKEGHITTSSPYEHIFSKVFLHEFRGSQDHLIAVRKWPQNGPLICMSVCMMQFFSVTAHICSFT